MDTPGVRPFLTENNTTVQSKKQEVLQLFFLRLYEALRVSRWQSRVPDMSKLFPKLMPPKKMPARPDEQTLLVMIRETCAAEATHTLLMLAGLGVIVIWPCVWGVMLYLVYAILGNLIFIIIQRYNRPRLVRLYERKRAKRSKEA